MKFRKRLRLRLATQRGLTTCRPSKWISMGFHLLRVFQVKSSHRIIEPSTYCIAGCALFCVHLSESQDPVACSSAGSHGFWMLPEFQVLVGAKRECSLSRPARQAIVQGSHKSSRVFRDRLSAWMAVRTQGLWVLRLGREVGVDAPS